ncbi:Interferon-related developmental regulator 1 [Halotydeus destructor]|nr:Interferon-related developmental regulator 1 [Halotydeus destructor]
MPKNARRAKGKASKRTEQNGLDGHSEDDSNNDNASVISVTSSSKLDGYGSDTTEHYPEENGDDGYYDDFEEKIVEAIDLTTEKTAKTRLMAIEAIKKAFTTRYMFDFIAERKVTITDVLERCLKRGKGEEQGAAAILAAVICTTLGSTDETDALLNEFESVLITTMNDPTASPTARAKCATALGLCCFVAANGSEKIDRIMDILLSIFSKSFLKGDKTIPSHGPQVTALHSSALLSWSLLTTVQPTSVVLNLTKKYCKKISELLDSPDVELRICAGETIALLHEISRECDEYFEVEHADVLYSKLRQMATDSHKYRAKKDRRVQRSSFRDVLKCCEEGETLSEVTKFGRERLLLDSWCRKRQYDAFCHVLGSGMNMHLSVNDLLRDIFELGAPIPDDMVTSKVTKFERHMENLAISKARTRVRGRLRDKRADIL